MKLKCATLIAALLMAISVFLGSVGHTEYKSQMRKRKAHSKAIKNQPKALNGEKATAR